MALDIVGLCEKLGCEEIGRLEFNKSQYVRNKKVRI